MSTVGLSSSNALFEVLIKNGNYNLIVVITFLACDIVETFENELECIWKKKFGIISVLYGVTRYLPLFINVVLLALETTIDLGTHLNVNTRLINLLYCIPWFVVLACTQYLFIMRAVALNESSRLLYSGAITLFIAEIITGLVLYSVSLSSNSLSLLTHSQPTVVTFPDSQLSIAMFPKLSSIIAFGVPALSFQCLLIPVIVPTIIRHRKTPKSRMENEVVVLATVMIRDGMWGFVINFISVLVIIIQPIWLAGPLGTPNLQWSYLTFSVTSSRFLLNIRSIPKTLGVSGDKLLTSLCFNDRGARSNDTEEPLSAHELDVINEEEIA